MKKPVNIALLVIVLGIWGAIIYRMVANVSPAGSPAISKTARTSMPDMIRKDTFEIADNVKDPFLGAIGTLSTAPATGTTRLSKPRKALAVPAVPVRWPKVEYYGYIKREKSKNPRIIVKVDNTIHRVYQSEAIGSVKIDRVYSDSIVVSMNREKKVIKKN